MFNSFTVFGLGGWGGGRGGVMDSRLSSDHIDLLDLKGSGMKRRANCDLLVLIITLTPPPLRKI